MTLREKTCGETLIPSVIESTTLPITLILSNANYQMQLVVVVDSISFQFQLPITQLPVSEAGGWLGGRELEGGRLGVGCLRAGRNFGGGGWLAALRCARCVVGVGRRNAEE